MGLPGAMPVINPHAVRQALRAALALGCRVNMTSTFARKHYFYPDLPKGYQITQYELPLAEAGVIELDDGEIAIARVHIEEDSGKLIHTRDSSLIDYNRSGVPLAEIVTAPTLASPAQARIFLETLKQVMEYTGVSDCKMEEGSLRCDANISLQVGDRIGARTEIKNLNSFRAVELALSYEVQRQSKLLEEGCKVLPQTMRWDEAKAKTVPMRGKETAVDYRYMPEPDLPPLGLSQEMLREEAESVPELPRARRARFVRDYAIPETDAGIITRTRAMADWFENIVLEGTESCQAANWLTGEFSRLLNRKGCSIEDLPFGPKELASLIELNQCGEVSGTAAKQVLAEMFSGGGEPREIVNNLGLAQVSEDAALEAVVDKVLHAHPAAVQDFQGGREKALGYLMGQAMKLSQGRANPEILKEIFIAKIQL